MKTCAPKITLKTYRLLERSVLRPWIVRTKKPEF
jgi:hypothetical protein